MNSWSEKYKPTPLEALTFDRELGGGFVLNVYFDRAGFWTARLVKGEGAALSLGYGSGTSLGPQGLSKEELLERAEESILTLVQNYHRSKEKLLTAHQRQVKDILEKVASLEAEVFEAVQLMSSVTALLEREQVDE